MVKLTRDRTPAVPPPAHVRVLGAGIDDEDREQIARKLAMKLGKFAASLERITVRLSDANGPKDGTIEAASEGSGRGTRMIVRLPLARTLVLHRALR